MNTDDIRKILVDKYKRGEFRTIGNAIQQSKTVEIQNANFEVDKYWIVREPNFDYAQRELEWYMTKSLNVNDIPGGTPKMWLATADVNGMIHSNYGWCIWSEENYNQYEHCLNKLVEDNHTREACMIYTRPSIQDEYNMNGMHDFICTYSVQCFLNEDENNEKQLDYIVYMRSNDAVFGFDNDAIWHGFVQHKLAQDLTDKLGETVKVGKMYWNAGSLHVYERHFKFLEQ